MSNDNDEPKFSTMEQTDKLWMMIKENDEWFDELIRNIDASEMSEYSKIAIHNRKDQSTLYHHLLRHVKLQRDLEIYEKDMRILELERKANKAQLENIRGHKLPDDTEINNLDIDVPNDVNDNETDNNHSGFFLGEKRKIRNLDQTASIRLVDEEIELFQKMKEVLGVRTNTEVLRYALYMLWEKHQDELRPYIHTQAFMQ